jgi:rhodanese-related sulfurtransferase
MVYTTDEIRANRGYFLRKLHAVEGGSFNFVLLDTRGRNAFAGGHIPGALCVPIEELDQLTSLLPKDKGVVTCCWGHD